MSTPMLILASRSARRASLLAEAGLAFVQADPPFEDPPHPEDDGVTPPELAMRLATRKALSMRGTEVVKRHPGAVVLGADTLIVHHDGSLAGTPTNAAEARAMLKKFVGRRHQVVTGVALWSTEDDRVDAFADVADVDVGSVSDDAIDQYLQGNGWRGKAGGYNLHERLAAGWRIVVHGESTTVVGLPMPMLLARRLTW
ncbi:MAG: Maf-like protein [Phycisphaeraceae bacterium]|nr:Maf-like protein [Phycisphaeraceae bacterium]